MAKGSLWTLARTRVGNPVVCWVLRSRAHRLLSRSMLVLEYTGRRSGRRLVLPVMYASLGSNLVVVAGQHQAKNWWRNFGTEAQGVTATVKGVPRRVTARRLLPDADGRTEAMSAYKDGFPRAVLEATAPVLLLEALK
jgi:hypothetical protein